MPYGRTHSWRREGRYQCVKTEQIHDAKQKKMHKSKIYRFFKESSLNISSHLVITDHLTDGKNDEHFLCAALYGVKYFAFSGGISSRRIAIIMRLCCFAPFSKFWCQTITIECVWLLFFFLSSFLIIFHEWKKKHLLILT